MQILEAFKQLCATKGDLQETLGLDLYNVDCPPVCLQTADVERALTAYLKGALTKERLVEWVNVVWFTGLFEIPDAQADSVVSVLAVLETLDETEAAMSVQELEIMLDCLRENRTYL